MKKITKIITSVVSACIISVSATGIVSNAKSVSWLTPYGVASGSSRAYSWSMGNSPLYAFVEARTDVTVAAPHIWAEVIGYKGNTPVLQDEAKLTDSKYVISAASSTSYKANTLWGDGKHAVWSSTYKRVNYSSSFDNRK